MGRFTRGFMGRGKAARDPRLPPGQYDTGQAVAGAHGRGHAEARHRRRGRSRSRGSSSSRRRGRGTRSTRCPRPTYEGDIHCVTTWSKLGDDVRAASRSTRCSPPRARCRPRRTCSRSRTPATRPTCRSPTSPAARRGSCGRSTASRCRGDHGGPARLLVPHLYFWKSAKWVVGPASCSTTTSPASGSATATTTAATRGSSSATRATDVRGVRVVADARRSSPIRDETRAREDVPARARRARRRTSPGSTTSCGSPRPTATPRRARTRSRRRPTTRTRSSSPSSASTTARCRRSCTTCVEVGDELEVRGPIGGWFVWDGDTPALLVGGGSGVVPLMAMLRLARARPAAPTSCASSCRCASPDDLYYARRAAGSRDARVVYTRPRRPASTPPAGPPHRRRPRRPACAPTRPRTSAARRRFADAASDLLVDLGVPAEHIRVERFGPSG